MFKVNRGNLSSTMKGIIEPRTERICSFQSISDFFELLVNTVFHGRESIYTLRNLFRETFRNIDSLDIFKISIKKWKPANCFCMLRKVYIKMWDFYRIRNSALFHKTTF